MNLVEAVKEARARVQQINDQIAALQQQIADLQSERQTVAQDIADLRAYLATKGINA